MLLRLSGALLLSFGVCLHALAVDTEADIVITSQDRYELSRLFAYLEDAGGNLTLQDIL